MTIDVIGGLPGHPNLDDAGIRWIDGEVVGHPLGLEAFHREAEGTEPAEGQEDWQHFITLARRAYVNPEIFVDFLPLEEWLDLQE